MQDDGERHHQQWSGRAAHDDDNGPAARSPSKRADSDCESDYERRGIRPIWRPYERNDDGGRRPVYKPVRPGFGTRGCYRGPTAVEFDLKPGSPPEIGYAPSPTAVTGEENSGAMSREHNAAEAKRLQRVDEMRKRFERKSLVPDERPAVDSSSSFASVETRTGNGSDGQNRFRFFFLLHDFIIVVVLTRRARGPNRFQSSSNVVERHKTFFRLRR